MGIANDYNDTSVAAATAHSDANDVATLASANSDANAGDAATLQTANTYTDTRSTATLTSANAHTDQRMAALVLDFGGFRTEMNDRFDVQDKRIDKNGAMSAAMMQMAGNSAYAKPGRGRLSMGLGFQESEAAVSIGYGHRIGDNVSLSIGAAFADDESSAGVGLGIDL